MCHRDLLLRLHHRLDALRQARKLYAPKLAPEFNAIGLCGPDELRLSQILKELLSPIGSHAQGAIFLKLFLKCFDLENFLPVPDNTKVCTEKTTDRLANKMLRMDIHLDFGPAAIAIENKPWAGDQENQCMNYLNQLALSHPELNCLIYLSGSDEPPSTDSISKDEREDAENVGHFKIIAYPQLIDWLKDCRRECQTDRVSFFLNEFIDYIQNQFVGIEMVEMQEVVNIDLKDSATLQAALELVQAHSTIKLKLLEQLENQLIDKLGEWRLEWDVHSKNTPGLIFIFQNRKNMECDFNLMELSINGLVMES
ncbi:MAG: PD-(D/E)XK nuclease family protein [Candidatus Methylumidiphilus sp.]